MDKFSLLSSLFADLIWSYLIKQAHGLASKTKLNGV
jgi:hypothetical protein